jgi:hypothetical protein
MFSTGSKVVWACAVAAGIALALLFYDLRLRGEGVQLSPDRPVEAGASPAPQGA